MQAIVDGFSQCAIVPGGTENDSISVPSLAHIAINAKQLHRWFLGDKEQYAPWFHGQQFQVCPSLPTLHLISAVRISAVRAHWCRLTYRRYDARFQKESMMAKRTRRLVLAWSKADVKNLRTFAKDKLSGPEAAKKLRRTPGAVAQKAMKLGVRFRSIRRKMR
jgi:hypothetical protein